jgi:hypothetical protein
MGIRTFASPRPTVGRKDLGNSRSEKQIQVTFGNPGRDRSQVRSGNGREFVGGQFSFKNETEPIIRRAIQVEVESQISEFTFPLLLVFEKQVDEVSYGFFENKKVFQ